MAPIVLDSTEPNISSTLEGVCPICLTELQVGVAYKPTIVPDTLDELTNGS